MLIAVFITEMVILHKYVYLLLLLLKRRALSAIRPKALSPGCLQINEPSLSFTLFRLGFLCSYSENIKAMTT